MAYIKYKEITKYFNFSSVLDKKKLPKYVKDYVFKDEQILCAYKTSTDHGIFTTEKIVLFDNYSLFGVKKQVYAIPYESISTCSVIFYPRNAELSLFLDSGYPVRLKFAKMSGIDKLRLRLLYSAILKIISNQKLSKEESDNLIEDKISFESGEK
jgi:hypothetical protein